MRKIPDNAKVICKSCIVFILLSVILIVTIGICGCSKRDANSFSSDDDLRFRKIYEGAGEEYREPPPAY